MKSNYAIRRQKLAQVESLGAVFQERIAKITALDFENSKVLVEWFDVYKKRNGKPWVIPTCVTKWVAVDKSMFKQLNIKSVSHHSGMGGDYVRERWHKGGHFINSEDRKKILAGI